METLSPANPSSQSGSDSASDKAASKLDRIVARLTERIAVGEWPEGTALPSRNRFADEFGVSPSTISNVISQLQKAGLVHAVPSRGVFVSPSTGEESSKAAYPPIALYGSYIPAQQKQGSFYGKSLVHAIWDAAHTSNAPILLMPGVSDKARLSRQYVQSLGARGIIFLGAGVYDDAYEFRSAGFPVVLSNRPRHATPLNYVDYDHEALLLEALRRFTEAGHRRIAVVTNSTAIPHFYDGLKPIFIDEMCKRGLVSDFNRDWIYAEVDTSTATAECHGLEENLTELLRGENPPTAILSFSYHTLPAIRAAEKNAGARLSLITSGYSMAEQADVSTFLLNQSLFGQSLLQVIHETIENPMAFIQRQIPFTFVDKGTIYPIVS